MSVRVETCWLLVVFFTIPGVAACAQEDQGPFLSPSRVITLREAGDHFIGKPGGVLPLSDGSLVVADFFSNSASRFDEAGVLLEVYGREDSGAVTLGSVGGAMFVAGDRLGIVDFSPRQIGLFDLTTGKGLGTIRYEGLVTAAREGTGGVWIAGISTSTGKGLAWLDETVLEAAVRGEAPSVDLELLELPSLYIRSDAVRGIYGMASLAVDQPTGLLVAFAADTSVLRVGLDGQIHGSVYVPVARRRGVPEDFEGQMDPAQRAFDEIFGMASGIMAVSSDDRGFVYVAHLDASRTGGTISGSIYLSVVAKDGSRACVDQKVESSGFGAPVVALHGSEAFVVDQRPPPEGGNRFETVVRVFELDLRNCESTGI